MELLQGNVSSYAALKPIAKRVGNQISKWTKQDITSPDKFELATGAIFLLSSILSFDDDVEELISSDLITSISRRIRTWLAGADGVRLEGVSQGLIASVAKLFQRLVASDHDFDINIAGFIVDFGRSLLKVCNGKLEFMLWKILS
jgi:hypothetical protein